MKQDSLVSRIAMRVTLGALLVTTAASAARAAEPPISYERATAPLVALHSADMRMLPQEANVPLQHRPGTMPLLTGTDPRTWYARKLAARYSRIAPYDPRPIPAWYDPTVYTPAPAANFAGMADSATICPYFGGCAPPDMALAASSTFVMQGVNTSFAVYSPTGTILAGWPKNATTFFGIPKPGACDPLGPFTSDPRAFYDAKDGRFWVAELQVEGAFGINSCPEKSIYWIGVSKTSNPTGGWHIYSFDMTLGTTNAADYTQIGIDGTAFYFGANMFNSFGTAYVYDEIFAASKARMEAGMPVTAHGLKKIKVGTTLIDTLQPILVEGASPAAGLFIDSFNIYSGGGNCFNGCRGFNVFAMANQLTAPTLTHATISSRTYTTPPNADEPGCTECIETLDTRISSTPVYRGGMITFSIGTGVTNSSTTVPGIQWGQVKPILSGSKITGGKMVQNAVLSFTGDRDASFGALMSDKNGNIAMVFDSMSSTIFPAIYYVSRLATDPLSTFEPPVNLHKGLASYGGSGRWGDYEATSYDGATANKVWIASQYSNSIGDWSTEIGKLHL